MILSGMASGAPAEEQTEIPEPSNEKQVQATAESASDAQDPHQKHRSAKRKRMSATETFCNTMLEKKN
ncbi:hypothetical protein MRX96_019755 [Rhipicephalus microplus]